jgi:hypothetical protein
VHWVLGTTLGNISSIRHKCSKPDTVALVPYRALYRVIDDTWSNIKHMTSRIMLYRTILLIGFTRCNVNVAKTYAESFRCTLLTKHGQKNQDDLQDNADH